MTSRLWTIFAAISLVLANAQAVNAASKCSEQRSAWQAASRNLSNKRANLRSSARIAKAEAEDLKINYPSALSSIENQISSTQRKIAAENAKVERKRIFKENKERDEENHCHGIWSLNSLTEYCKRLDARANLANQKLQAQKKIAEYYTKVYLDYIDVLNHRADVVQRLYDIRQSNVEDAYNVAVSISTDLRNDAQADYDSARATEQAASAVYLNCIRSS